MIRKMTVVASAAVLAIVMGCASNESSAPGDAAKAGAAEVTPELLAQGEKLYQSTCASCHGATGKGDGPAAGALRPPPRDHTDRAYMRTLSDKDIADIIKMGGAIKGKPQMPSHPQFNDEQLRALVAYVRSLGQPAQ